MDQLGHMKDTSLSTTFHNYNLIITIISMKKFDHDQWYDPSGPEKSFDRLGAVFLHRMIPPNQKHGMRIFYCFCVLC